MEDVQHHYVAWLRDAHAVEEQAQIMLRGQLQRLEHYQISATESECVCLRQSIKLLRCANCWKAVDAAKSVMKHTTGKVGAAGQEMSGKLTPGEFNKSGMTSYTFENMAIAA